MRWYGKEITVARGETFSLTCKITNEDGTPYMISSNLQNPTFLLTVANTLYKSDDKRYVLRCWTPLVTRSMNDAEVITSFPENPVTNKLYHLIEEQVVDEIVYPIGYYKYNGSEWITFSSYVNGYVFDSYEILDKPESDTMAGVERRLYYSADDKKYYIYTDNQWKEYETTFVQNFPSHITKEWYSKNFYYELRLISGDFTASFEQALEDDNYGSYQDNPFKSIDDEFVIIPKTQLNVLSRLGGYNNG